MSQDWLRLIGCPLLGNSSPKIAGKAQTVLHLAAAEAVQRQYTQGLDICNALRKTRSVVQCGNGLLGKSVSEVLSHIVVAAGARRYDGCHLFASQQGCQGKEGICQSGRKVLAGAGFEIAGKVWLANGAEGKAIPCEDGVEELRKLLPVVANVGLEMGF